MATKRMLIDATQPEETRVAVIEGDRLVDYDVEVASRRQLKGNIYLAKVTRVEPSLQAAFVDYGGERHGFLAFSEIHPDYYQIPVADREALLAEQKETETAEEAAQSALAAAKEGTEPSEEAEAVEVTGTESIDEEEEELEIRRPRPSPRRYKIQEVIKRRQIMLVQVTKEERGTKGAALTTYLSLAGRYCVLMPTTTRGGGISRKITNAADRKRLKKILGDLPLPEGMAVILRTAGAERSKAEIRRDYEYLFRLWNNIRETTLSSMAPTLVHEEGSLIKRSIRDLYDRAIDEILVEGEEAYRAAKDFMRLLIPSHAKRVKLYEDPHAPLFQRFKVEHELEAMHLPKVELKSGGSIVINPTEALVAIDVNSGRATRERHIEETALRTNLEACDEIARQLRLRDLAGLIVIDFIDMEASRNQKQVERRLKEAMKGDRARVQLGRISPFGLLELSRQRLRPSLLETSFETCSYCAGTGVLRTTESAALAILRRIDEEGSARSAEEITVTTPAAVASYLLNRKRQALLEKESRYGILITLFGDASLVPPHYEIERIGRPLPRVEEEGGGKAAETALPEEQAEEAGEKREEAGKRGRRRRPRRRKHPEEEQRPGAEAAAKGEETEGEEEAEELKGGEREEGEDEAATAAKKRRRRGKRGGRRRATKTAEEAEAEARPAAPAGHLPEPGTLLSPPISHGLMESAVPEAEAAAEEATEEPAAGSERAVGEADQQAPEAVEKEGAEAERESGEQTAASASPTAAIDVDDTGAAAQQEQPRKGWWQQLLG